MQSFLAEVWQNLTDSGKTFAVNLWAWAVANPTPAVIIAVVLIVVLWMYFKYKD